MASRRQTWAVCGLLALSGCGAVDSVTRSVTNLTDDWFGGAPTAGQAAPVPEAAAVRLADDTVAAAAAVTPDAVVDGDTLVIAGEQIRLYGIDALERGQACRTGGGELPCGEMARNVLIGFTAGAPVRCERVDTDGAGRRVSRCRADEYDLSAGMVLAGFAVAYHGNPGTYVLHEATAKAQRKGMWKSTFDMPWLWRPRPGA